MLMARMNIRYNIYKIYQVQFFFVIRVFFRDYDLYDQQHQVQRRSPSKVQTHGILQYSQTPVHAVSTPGHF